MVRIMRISVVIDLYFSVLSVYSLRIYPHLQDTGGFFIAVLQKKLPRNALSRIPTKEALYVIKIWNPRIC